jgi:hypothetical protein
MLALIQAALAWCMHVDKMTSQVKNKFRIVATNDVRVRYHINCIALIEAQYETDSTG